MQLQRNLRQTFGELQAKFIADDTFVVHRKSVLTFRMNFLLANDSYKMPGLFSMKNDNKYLKVPSAAVQIAL